MRGDNSGTHVVVVSRWYPMEEGELAGVFVRDHVRVVETFAETTVLVPEEGATARALRSLADRRRLEGEEVLPLPRLPALGVFARWVALERALARTRRPDVVHVHLTLPDALPALAAAHRRHIPVVVTEHADYAPRLSESVRGRVQLRQVLRRADAVIAVAQWLADDLRAIEPRARLVVLGNPVDTKRFSPDPAARRDFALNVSVSPGIAKGTDVLLRAWALARRVRELPRLIIVGDGPERPQMVALARSLALDGVCEFTGRQTPEQLASLMRNAAFAVSASRSETFAKAVAEAIAAGTPVVSTNVGEPSRYVTQEVGVLVPPGSVDALADAILAMAERASEYDPSRLHAHIDELYGYATTRRRLLEIYASVLERRGRTGIR